MVIGSKNFNTDTAYICGILNVTPDSFYAVSRAGNVDEALKRAEALIKDGADIIDIGGESTRPGYSEITVSEEIERTAPVIEKIKEAFDIPISLDTFHAECAKAGIRAGADMINDVKGLRGDEGMAQVIADSKVACCLMHNREKAVYGDLLSDIVTDLSYSLKLASDFNIPDEKIILDPGIGFGKTTEDNLRILNNIDYFKRLGYPLLIGASRKSVIGNTLKLPVEERLEGTLAVTALSAMQGAFLIRVHDVKENRRALDMALAILNS